MARADLLKKLFIGYQSRNDAAFREAADELIDEERRKHHAVVANELEKIMKNGSGGVAIPRTMIPFQSAPMDSERKMSLLEVRQPQRFLNDLVVSQSIRGTIDRIMREFRDWDVLESNGLLPIRRVVFCGPSGCGKTAMAEAISAELGVPMLYVRFDAVVSSLLGETAANLRKVFDYAQRGRWILFFDEFDAIARSRDDATEHGEIKRVLNSFLQIMDNFGGRSLVIAATNFEQVLDPAIWRRFDEMVQFDRPSAIQVALLIRKRLAALQFTDAQVEILANRLNGTSYADAERACLDVRKECVLEGVRQVADRHIDEALSRSDYRQSILRKVLTPTQNPSISRE